MRTVIQSLFATMLALLLGTGTAAPPAAPAQSAAPPTEPGYYGALSVRGGQLTDASGTPVVLRGLSTHGLSWFPEYANPQLMEQMQAQWNCNVLRLALYTEEYNGYCSGSDANRQTLRGRVDDAVQAAIARNMYIIIDWHILSDGNPLTHQQEAVEFFSDLSARYADSPHVLYEICNEPNGATTWQDICTYANAVIPAIRANSDGVILVGTPTWSQDLAAAMAAPLSAHENIMYTLHFYAATHKQPLRDTLRTAATQGFPVFVSEFGICDASGSGTIDENEAALWMDLLQDYQISYVMWNLSNKAESSAMFRPSCTKTAAFTTDDLTPAGLWFLKHMNAQPNATGAAPSASAAPSPALSGNTSAVQLDLRNTWASGSAQSFQYDITLRPNTDLSGWSLTLTFSGAVSLESSWGGNYHVQENTVTITPMDYNSTLSKDMPLSGIGFIVSGAEDLCILDALLTQGNAP